MRVRIKCISELGRTYIFDPNERANVRNVVDDMFGSTCVFIYRQIGPVSSRMRETLSRWKYERSRDLFPLTEVKTTRIALKIVSVPVVNAIYKVLFYVFVHSYRKLKVVAWTVKRISNYNMHWDRSSEYEHRSDRQQWVTLGTRK